LRDEPPENIGRTSRRKRHDHRDRTPWILIFGACACDTRATKEAPAARNYKKSKSGTKFCHSGLTTWNGRNFKA
jgi:hypothetical protein